MSKATNALITAETEQPNLNRRTALMLAAGAAVAATSPGTAAASGGLSEGCLRCIRAWEHWMQDDLDDFEHADVELADRDNKFMQTLRDYLNAAAVMAPVQRLAELNVLWRLDAWTGDSRDGETTMSEPIELALQKTIEEITGMPRSPEVVWTVLTARGLLRDSGKEEGRHA